MAPLLLNASVPLVVAPSLLTGGASRRYPTKRTAAFVLHDVRRVLVHTSRWKPQPPRMPCHLREVRLRRPARRVGRDPDRSRKLADCDREGHYATLSTPLCNSGARSDLGAAVAECLVRAAGRSAEPTHGRRLVRRSPTKRTAASFWCRVVRFFAVLRSRTKSLPRWNGDQPQTHKPSPCTPGGPLVGSVVTAHRPDGRQSSRNTFEEPLSIRELHGHSAQATAFVTSWSGPSSNHSDAHCTS